MNIITGLADFILHLDVHLGQIIRTYGALTYALLFTIVFVETGLVLMPFLPGDSLLFAAGAFAALKSLDIVILLVVFSVAAIVGDTVNYWIGHFFGERIIANPRIPINQEHIDKTHAFFKKYGGKTIILARFVPIVRTFAPFVAGIGKMEYKTFLSYNIFGGLFWVISVTLAGFFFGNIAFVKDNFSLIVILIVVLSVAPMVLHLIPKKPASNKK